MPWRSQANAIFAKSHSFTKIIRQHCQIYRQLLLPAYWLTLAVTFWLLWDVLKTRTKRLMENAFIKIAIYFFVPHAMMFTNKCHLCKITKFYKDQGCPNRRQSFQICRLLPPYWLSLAIRLGLYPELFWNQGKEINGKCFCKDCKIYFRTPYHDVHKQVPSLLNHKILQGSRMPKSQSCKTTEFYDGQGCQNHKQSCQICRLLTPYWLSLAIILRLF